MSTRYRATRQYDEHKNDEHKYDEHKYDELRRVGFQPDNMERQFASYQSQAITMLTFDVHALFDCTAPELKPGFTARDIRRRANHPHIYGYPFRESYLLPCGKYKLSSLSRGVDKHPATTYLQRVEENYKKHVRTPSLKAQTTSEAMHLDANARSYRITFMSWNAELIHPEPLEIVLPFARTSPHRLSIDEQDVILVVLQESLRPSRELQRRFMEQTVHALNGLSFNKNWVAGDHIGLFLPNLYGTKANLKNPLIKNSQGLVWFKRRTVLVKAVKSCRHSLRASEKGFVGTLFRFAGAGNALFAGLHLSTSEPGPQLGKLIDLLDIKCAAAVSGTSPKTEAATDVERLMRAFTPARTKALPTDFEDKYAAVLWSVDTMGGAQPTPARDLRQALLAHRFTHANVCYEAGFTYDYQKSCTLEDRAVPVGTYPTSATGVPRGESLRMVPFLRNALQVQNFRSDHAMQVWEIELLYKTNVSAFWQTRRGSRIKDACNIHRYRVEDFTYTYYLYAYKHNTRVYMKQAYDRISIRVRVCTYVGLLLFNLLVTRYQCLRNDCCMEESPWEGSSAEGAGKYSHEDGVASATVAAEEEEEDEQQLDSQEAAQLPIAAEDGGMGEEIEEEEEEEVGEDEGGIVEEEGDGDDDAADGGAGGAEADACVDGGVEDAAAADEEPLDPDFASWAVVSSFFHSHGLVNQQIESFNDFVLYKIQEIIDEHPPIEIR
ncbi:UNVERIFIED_CONTAM: hypothetical protein H355_012707 [Colinus virginianus]|nr:hypothetical protein H355_012707 [Colinus virginianus]